MSKIEHYTKNKSRIVKVCFIFCLVFPLNILAHIYLYFFPQVYIPGTIVQCTSATETEILAKVSKLPEVLEYQQKAVEEGHKFILEPKQSGNTWEVSVKKQSEDTEYIYNTYNLDRCGTIRCSKNIFYYGKFIRKATDAEFPCSQNYENYP